MTPQPRYLRIAPTPAPTPIGGLMDNRFIYVPANKTDLHATFARIRAQLLKERHGN